MLGCTKATRKVLAGPDFSANRLIPKPIAAATASSGNAISPQIRSVPGRRASEIIAPPSATENQTIKNESPNTPVNAAIWINGNIRYWDVPRKFHGNPPRNLPRINSNAVHAAAHNKAQPIRFHSGVDKIRSTASAGDNPASQIDPGKIRQQNQ